MEILFGMLVSCHGNGFGIFDGAGQGRFAVNVFTRLQRILNDFLVLMARSGNHDRFDVLIGQKILVVGILLGIGCRATCSSKEGSIMITQRDHGCIGKHRQCAHDVSTMISASNNPEFDGRPRIGGSCLGERWGGLQDILAACHHGHDTRHGSTFQEIPTVQIDLLSLFLHKNNCLSGT